MIRFESGSVFDYDTQAIVNTVNTVGVMGMIIIMYQTSGNISNMSVKKIRIV